MAAPTCRNCGAVCEWGDVDGKWRLFTDGRPHRCIPKAENIQPVLLAEMPAQAHDDEPVEQSDVQRLSRQVARLATAIEDLTDEIREMNRKRVST